MRASKVILPVAGLGTRFLPATKTIPKEMLPIVDRPLIQYAVEEAVEAGVDTLIFITSSRKHAISDHFDTDADLERHLQSSGSNEALSAIRDIIPSRISRVFVPQDEALGLGHAVGRAAHLIGDEPFAVMLADELIHSDGRGCLAEMLDLAEQQSAGVLAVQAVAAEMVSKYGIVSTDKSGRILSMVEKPEPGSVDSTLAAVGRYVLPPGVMRRLESAKPGAGGEIQLTDAIAASLGSEPFLAHEFPGRRYDCGSKQGYIEATLDFALEREEFRETTLNLLANRLERHER